MGVDESNKQCDDKKMLALVIQIFRKDRRIGRDAIIKTALHDKWLYYFNLLLTLIYSIGHTQVASTAPAMHPAASGRKGFLFLLLAMFAT